MILKLLFTCFQVECQAFDVDFDLVLHGNVYFCPVIKRAFNSCRSNFLLPKLATDYVKLAYIDFMTRKHQSVVSSFRKVCCFILCQFYCSFRGAHCIAKCFMGLWNSMASQVHFASWNKKLFRAWRKDLAHICKWELTRKFQRFLTLIFPFSLLPA